MVVAEGDGEPDADDRAPLTPQLLADLQAGLLDDDTAARVRRRLRADPAAAHRLAVLDEVRRDLSRLGTGDRSAPDVPAELTARIGAALRHAPPPRRSPRAAHGLGRGLPRLARWQLAALVTGAGAVLLAAGLGVAALLDSAPPSRPTGPTARSITVARPAPAFPLTRPQILELLDRSPVYGPQLSDPARRASCLAGLGYPAATAVLGAGPVDVGGHSAELLVLPGDPAGTLSAFVVAPDCGAAHPGPLAHTVVRRR